MPHAVYTKSLFFFLTVILERNNLFLIYIYTV